MHRTDERALKRFKALYGQRGPGSSHTREASELEVRRHVQKAKSMLGGANSRLITLIRTTRTRLKAGRRKPLVSSALPYFMNLGTKS